MSSQGYVRGTSATVTLTTGDPGNTEVEADTGIITTGIWNGRQLQPAYIPSASQIPGAGSVTSVALTAPAEFSVAGSPITTAGTLAITKATQTANKVWASATSGGAAQPAFRALVTADLPAGTGTVTSVGLSVPGVIFTSPVSGSPVTTSGTLALALNTQTANKVFAGPGSGGATTPTFRALVTADLPAGTGTVTSVAASVPSFLNVAGSPITTSGTLAITLSGTALPTANGGTGLTTYAVTNGLVYASSASVLTQVALNATATKEYLSQTSSGVPVFAQVAAADLSGLAAVATSGSAADLGTGTLPSGRLVGAYSSVTGVGTLTALTISGDLTLGANSTILWTGNQKIVSPIGGQDMRIQDSTGADTVTLRCQNFRASGFVNGSTVSLGFNSTISNPTGGIVQVANANGATGTNVKSDGQLQAAYKISDNTGTLGVYQSRGSVYTSYTAAHALTLPTPANSYAGQAVIVVQAGGNIQTLTAPAGVTVSMKTGTSLVTGLDTITTKTAASFVTAGGAGADSTSAILVCVATDASTVATWMQVGGIGDWT